MNNVKIEKFPVDLEAEDGYFATFFQPFSVMLFSNGRAVSLSDYGSQIDLGIIDHKKGKETFWIEVFPDERIIVVKKRCKDGSLKKILEVSWDGH